MSSEGWASKGTQDLKRGLPSLESWPSTKKIKSVELKRIEYAKKKLKKKLKHLQNEWKQEYKIEDLKKSKTDLKNKLEFLESAKEKSEDKISKLECEKADLNVENARYQQTFESMGGQIEDLKKSETDLKNKLKLLESEKTKSEDKISKLECEKADLNVENARYQKTFESMGGLLQPYLKLEMPIPRVAPKLEKREYTEYEDKPVPKDTGEQTVHQIDFKSEETNILPSRSKTSPHGGAGLGHGQLSPLSDSLLDEGILMK